MSSVVHLNRIGFFILARLDSNYSVHGRKKHSSEICSFIYLADYLPD